MNELVKKSQIEKINEKEAELLLDVEMNEVLGGNAGEMAEDKSICGCVLFARA